MFQVNGTNGVYDNKVSEGKKDEILLKNHKNPLNITNLSCNNRTMLAFHYINNANKIFPKLSCPIEF